MITANRKVTDDAKQFVDLQIPGVLSLGKCVFPLTLSCYGIVPKSDQRILGKTRYSKFFIHFL